MLSKFVIKYGDKAVYLIGGFIVLVFAVIMIVMFANTGEKTPVTCEELNTKLIVMGYEPIDSTYYYQEQNSHLKGSIAIDTGNLRFDFFEFDNDDSAYTLFYNNHDLIYENISDGFREWDAHYNNYAMYSMSSNGVYYISIWVGNTVVYAYCNNEYTNEIDNILVSLDYGSSTKNKRHIFICLFYLLF